MRLSGVLNLQRMHPLNEITNAGIENNNSKNIATSSIGNVNSIRKAVTSFELTTTLVIINEAVRKIAATVASRIRTIISKLRSFLEFSNLSIFSSSLSLF